MSASEILKTVIRSGAGVPRTAQVTAALSGGADSTALLLCLHEMQEELGFSLRAVHVHHGIRGQEADRDAAFCEDLCKRYGIPFRLMRVDAPAYAAAEKLSLETAARKLRYAALYEAAPEGEIATAHHAGDNAETVLFHLIRGSGMRGLCGIPPRSPDGRIIRPLLNAEKEIILAYLQEKNQPFLEDSTNAELLSSRNRIQHRIIPLLKQENPAAVQHVSRCAELLSEDEALLSQLADSAYNTCKNPVSGGMRGLMQYPKPVRMRVYLRMIAETEMLCHAQHIDPDYGKLCAVDALTEAGKGKISLSSDVYAQAERGILYIGRTVSDLPALPLQIGKNNLFPDRFCIAELYETDALSRNLHRSDTKSTLDFDMIRGRLVFRRICGRDRIRLPGRDFDTELRKQVQALVPVPERQSLYALYDDLGCIYCEKVGIAARVRPSAGTRRVLVLKTGAELPESAGQPEKNQTETSDEGVNDTWAKIAEY